MRETGHLKASLEGGGMLPKEFVGTFTSMRALEDAAVRYIKNKAAKSKDTNEK